MKVVIATDSGMVSEHFGRCPEFTFAEIENGKIIKKETIKSPGHSTGFLPKFFQEKGIETVIAGGAGWRAQQLFQEYGIKLILGVTGSTENALKELAEGKLKARESFCLPGKGKGYGIKKADGHE